MARNRLQVLGDVPRGNNRNLLNSDNYCSGESSTSRLKTWVEQVLRFTLPGSRREMRITSAGLTDKARHWPRGFYMHYLLKSW